MVVEAADIAIDSGEHVVCFYDQESELAQTACEFLTAAARDAAVAIVIATEAHRRAFDGAMVAAGIDTAQACREGTLIWLDAATTLAGFMADGRIDGDAFRQVVGSVVRQAVESGKPVRAYGEMVGLLWDAGDVPAAIELEELWNDLGRELQFSLMCGYHSESVSGPEHAESLHQICHLHSAVLPLPPRDELEALRPTGDEVSAEFAGGREAPRSARNFVGDVLARWGHHGQLLNDARLLVSELATNAVVHANSPFSVVATEKHARIRVSVSDMSPLTPTLRSNGAMATSGRGLHLVAALSADWGVDVLPEGKTVWAELQSQPRPI